MKLIERRTITQHVAEEQRHQAVRALASSVIEKGHGTTVAGVLLREGRATYIETELNRTTRFEWEIVDD